jgi:xanthine/uracil permease
MRWVARFLANGRRWRRRYIAASWLLLGIILAAFPFVYADLHRTVHPVVLVIVWIAAITVAARNVALAHLHTPHDHDGEE